MSKRNRKPFRRTNSIYSESTISTQNLKFAPAKITTHETKFEAKSELLKLDLEQISAPKPQLKKRIFCEKLKNSKTICHNVELVPTFKTNDPKICRTKETSKDKQVLKETICLKRGPYSISSSSESLSIKKSNQSLYSTPLRQSDVNTSQKVIKSNHTETKSLISSFQKWKQPCNESDPGSLQQKFIGKCFQKNMITKNAAPYRHKDQINFTRTEDARNLSCLKNPNFKARKKTNEVSIKEKIKLADNIDTSSSNSIDEADKICVEIDVDNPFGLDYHGFDYENTYREDEQDFQNVREYRKIKRYMDRKRTKREVDKLVECEERVEKFQLPEVFDINLDYDSTGERHEIVPTKAEYISESDQSGKLGKVYRTSNKPVNKFIVEIEEKQRLGRYRNLYVTKRKHDELKQKENEKLKSERDANKVIDLADNKFKDIFYKKPPKFEELKKVAPIKNEIRKYPHTLEETQRLKHKMKKTKVILKENAKLRENFYKNFGQFKKVKEANLNFSDISKSNSTLSEQSTDDNDHLEVGSNDSNKYNLRGFHFRLGTEIRGKYSTKQKLSKSKNMKGCMTRSEWFETIVPEKRRGKFYQYNPPQAPKNQRPDDPKLSLFRETSISKLKTINRPVRDEIRKPFGGQYITFRHKVLHVKKPRHLKVKKFHLTSFIYGDIKSRLSVTSSIDFMKDYKFGSLTEYIRSKENQKNMRKRTKRYRRMQHLGIPILQNMKEKNEFKCDESISSNSDWIPHEYIPKDKIDMKTASTLKLGRSNCTPFKLGHRQNFDNMPGTKFREPTLRQHPHYPRDYTLSITDDQLFAKENTSVPYLAAEPDDETVALNLEAGRKEYMMKLDARFHHDHWDPTQHKILRTIYKPKYPKLNPEVRKNIQRSKYTKKGFEKAIPPNIELRDVDLSLPSKYKLENIENERKPQKFSYTDDAEKHLTYNSKSNEYHTRTDNPEDFPGREKFLEFIQKIRQEKEIAGITDQSQLIDDLIDTNQNIEQLQAELSSIKSCLSSVDSSICTNFTHDSGSFLITEDKKIPMDYIRKSLVPFEELNRTRIKAMPTPNININPYKTLPFSGQKQEQYIKPTDKFHTFKSRLSNDLRSRLIVPTVDIHQKLLGTTDQIKSKPKVATDLDEIYIEELHNRPPIKIFKPKTSSALIKDAQRKKYVCWCIQQKIVEQKSAQEKEVLYYKNVQQMKILFQNLFNQWQKQHFDDLKAVESKIEPCYSTTDGLKKQLEILEKDLTIISMNIINIENNFIKLTILQNFHYLMMKQDWRDEYDWIHKNDDNILENFRESIEKRPFVNIRKRDRDDAWAIKEFYEDVYMKNQHEVIICFYNADQFISALDELKTKTFVCLLQLHFTMWLYTNLEHEYNQVLKWSEECSRQREKFETKDVKRTFMQNRGKYLQNQTKNLLNVPLVESIASHMLRCMQAFGDVLYEKVVPMNTRQSVKEDIDITEKYALIWDSLLDLLASVDEIQIEKRISIEKSYRQRLKYDTRLSKQAIQTEKRIQLSMVEVKRNLAPPYIKSKTPEKRQRSVLKKKKVIPKESEDHIPNKIKFFYKAFRDDDEPITIEAVQEIQEHLADIKDESVTFNFDYFLRINNYIPSYNFKTQIELTDGPEENYMKYRDVMPYVLQEVAIWEHDRKEKIEKHIKENQHLYKDISG